VISNKLLTFFEINLNYLIAATMVNVSANETKQAQDRSSD
jgi:hypothetical protein